MRFNVCSHVGRFMEVIVVNSRFMECVRYVMCAGKFRPDLHVISEIILGSEESEHGKESKIGSSGVGFSSSRVVDANQIICSALEEKK